MPRVEGFTGASSDKESTQNAFGLEIYGLMGLGMQLEERALQACTDAEDLRDSSLDRVCFHCLPLFPRAILYPNSPEQKNLATKLLETLNMMFMAVVMRFWTQMNSTVCEKESLIWEALNPRAQKPMWKPLFREEGHTPAEEPP